MKSIKEMMVLKCLLGFLISPSDLDSLYAADSLAIQTNKRRFSESLSSQFLCKNWREKIDRSSPTSEFQSHPSSLCPYFPPFLIENQAKKGFPSFFAHHGSPQHNEWTGEGLEFISFQPNCETMTYHFFSKVQFEGKPRSLHFHFVLKPALSSTLQLLLPPFVVKVANRNIGFRGNPFFHRFKKTSGFKLG